MPITTQKELTVGSAKVKVSPSGKIINNVDDDLAPRIPFVPRSNNNNYNKSKAKKNINNRLVPGRKNVSDKSDTDDGPVSDASVSSKEKVDHKDKFSSSKKLKTVTPTTAAIKSSNNPQAKGSTSKSVVKRGEEVSQQSIITKKLSLGDESGSKVPAAGTITKNPTEVQNSSSKVQNSLSKVSVSRSKGRKSSKAGHQKNHDRDSSSASSTNADHRPKKFKSKISKKSTTNNPTTTTPGEDSMMMSSRKKRPNKQQQEPAYFTTISPEFFTRLKQMANEATTSNMKSSVSLSNNRKSENPPSPPPPVKMETLSKLDVLAKGNFRQLLKKGKGAGGMSFQEAREALSLGHVPESLLGHKDRVNGRKTKEDIMADLTDGIVALNNSTVSDSSGHGLDPPGGGGSNNHNKSILSHGSHVSIKKQLRFADHGNKPAETISSNKTRIRRVGRKSVPKKLSI